MTLRAVGVLLVFVACASGCGRAAVSTGAASTSPSTSTQSYVELPVSRQLSWDSGHLILDPPPSATAPRITADAAYRATGPAGRADTPEVMFGLFTDTTMGNRTPSGLAVTYRQRPAWVVWHRHALVAPSCAPPPPGTQSTCGPVEENTLAVVDANTGQTLDLYTFP